MKPFDLVKAKEGAPLCTRDGRPRQVRYINDRVWWDGSCHNDEIAFTWREEEWINVCHAAPIELTDKLLILNDFNLVNPSIGAWVTFPNNTPVFVDYLPDEDKGARVAIHKGGAVKNIRYVHEFQRALRCLGMWDFAENFKV